MTVGSVCRWGEGGGGGDGCGTAYEASNKLTLLLFFFLMLININYLHSGSVYRVYMFHRLKLQRNRRNKIAKLNINIICPNQPSFVI